MDFQLIFTAVKTAESNFIRELKRRGFLMTGQRL